MKQLLIIISYLSLSFAGASQSKIILRNIPAGIGGAVNLSVLADSLKTRITKESLDLGDVPNIDATHRENHVGTQSSSTISDFVPSVWAALSSTDNSVDITNGVISTRKAVLTAADAANITLNIKLSYAWKVILGGNRTLSITNVQNGDIIILYVKQDATGGRTITWPGNVIWIGGAPPTLSAVTRVTLHFDGTDYYGSY